MQAGLSPAEASRLTIALRYVELLPAVLQVLQKFFISGVIIIVFNIGLILAAPYVTIAGQGTSKVVVSAHVSDASHPIVNAAGALQVGAAAAVGGVFALIAVAVTFILPLVIASFELFCLPCPLLAFMRT